MVSTKKVRIFFEYGAGFGIFEMSFEADQAVFAGNVKNFKHHFQEL